MNENSHNGLLKITWLEVKEVIKCATMGNNIPIEVKERKANQQKASNCFDEIFGASCFARFFSIPKALNLGYAAETNPQMVKREM